MIRHLCIGKLDLIETGKLYGNMNTNKNFYPGIFNKSERDAAFLARRIRLGNDYGFDGHKVFMADQKDNTGSWFEITKEYVNDHPMGWPDIDEDILILSKDNKGVVIGQPAADCPVIIVYDTKKEVAAVAHCSAYQIDLKMPKYVIEALKQAYDSKNDDIIAYISSCAGTDYAYDSYPKWAKDEKLWQDSIKEHNGLFHIDLRKAVLKELEEENLKRIVVSQIDTINNKGFYSNYAYKKGNTFKNGRNFVGCFFNDPKQRIKIKTK